MDKNHIITFDIWGEFFSPKIVDFKFDDTNERGDIHTIQPFRGKVMNYGSATYVVPLAIIQINPFKHLADTFEPLLPILIKAGATQWNIYVGRIYFEQCNEEISFEDISHIARLKCSLAYSAFKKSYEEELEGFDHGNYCQ